jgi:hypothetical protein
MPNRAPKEEVRHHVGYMLYWQPTGTNVWNFWESSKIVKGIAMYVQQRCKEEGAKQPWDVVIMEREERKVQILKAG